VAILFVFALKILGQFNIFHRPPLHTVLTFKLYFKNSPMDYLKPLCENNKIVLMVTTTKTPPCNNHEGVAIIFTIPPYLSA
jgi:hypothetical protein